MARSVSGHLAHAGTHRDSCGTFETQSRQSFCRLIGTSLVDSRIYLVLGSILAAAGQVLLKVGVSGATTLAGFINVRVTTGLACYVLGTVLWLIALSRMPLSRVYPFTILTFVIVYVAAISLLGERLTAPLFAGLVLVLAGLAIIATS